MFKSTGRIRYFTQPLKVIVEVDQQISEYYRTLVPRYIRLNRQAYPAHISVVRKETPPNMEFWNRYEKEWVEFEYEPYQYNNATYYWLNVFCPRLEEIRRELGLSLTSGITRSPDGRHKFHCTIGNCKHV